MDILQYQCQCSLQAWQTSGLVQPGRPCAHVRGLPLLTLMSVGSHEQSYAGSPCLPCHVNVFTTLHFHETNIYGSIMPVTHNKDLAAPLTPYDLGFTRQSLLDLCHHQRQ